MLARILVHIVLFCGVVVLGASLSSNSSSVADGGINNSTNSTNTSSTATRPKLLSTLLRLSNHTAKANKTLPAESNLNKTDNLKVSQVEIVLKNLTSANVTNDETSSNSTNSMKIREESNDDNSTRNATENSSANKTSSVMVERSVNLTANGTSLNDNSTKTGNNTEEVKKNETEKADEESLLEKAGIRILRRREAVSSNKTDDELLDDSVKQADDVLEDSADDGADILDDVSSPNEDE